MAAWGDGPRHRSWASDTGITFGLLVVLITATALVDAFAGEPPNYLVGLLGTAAGAFFGALSTDKAKRERDIAEVAVSAKRKADALGEVARQNHPDDFDDETGKEPS